MLVDIPVPHSITRAALSPAAARLIQDASRRIDYFTRSHRPRIDNFVVCDFALADAAIDWICRERLLCGDSFCEWGSGLGVVASMAAMLGFESYGIEIDEQLCRCARLNG